jgi:hypothetical protein
MAVPASAGVISAPRMIAAVLAGGALAAAGQTALTRTLPVATDGANMLKLSVQELVGTAATTAGDTGGTTRTAAVAPLVTLPAEIAPAAEPPVAGVSELVKAAQRQARGVTDAAAPAAQIA